MPRKPFLLRVDEQLLAALQRWANDELRSLNGQIEYVLRQAVLKRGAKLADPLEVEPPSSTNSDDSSANPAGE